jgi:hypothetical protein
VTVGHHLQGSQAAVRGGHYIPHECLGHSCDGALVVGNSTTPAVRQYLCSLNGMGSN